VIYFKSRFFTGKFWFLDPRVHFVALFLQAAEKHFSRQTTEASGGSDISDAMITFFASTFFRYHFFYQSDQSVRILARCALDCIHTLSRFFKLTKKTECRGCFCPRKKLWGNFDKQGVGLHFGRIFHKLIWSPCLPRRRWFSAVRSDKIRSWNSPALIAGVPFFSLLKTSSARIPRRDSISRPFSFSLLRHYIHRPCRWKLLLISSEKNVPFDSVSV
jgi:hypothetical protein